ncbi:MAG: hypothetical protein GXY46_07840 [Actinobacteria bacterium]|nr:hypothetical protein [Actinomycetota bacterium]
MNSLSSYAGRRDPRFVTIRRGGSLDDANHRLLAAWAADCAEHVSHHFREPYPNDPRPAAAIEQARAWSTSQVTMTQAREAAYAAHEAARASTGAASLSARAAGHAAATAHMADHALRAAAYAVRAVRAASSAEEQDTAARHESEWQIAGLPTEVRELVLSTYRSRWSPTHPGHQG